VGATRLTNPAVELAALPPVDVVLLSHYHEDHFDRDVERRLGRDVPIVTTPHARACLADGREEGDAFRRVYGVDAFESVVLDVGGGGGGGGARDMVKITGMPGKHVPPGPAGAVGALNDVLGAVPPTNGWDGEDAGGDDGEDGGGHESKNEGAHESQNAPSSPSASSSPSGYRIYISGDTLFVDELRAIPTWLGPRRRVDLMLVHLGGTTIPGPRLPLVMVTMDAAQGVALMRLVDPDATVPVHYDDYDVFASPLRDFKDAVNAAGWRDRVVYVDRGEEYRFRVREKGAV
jgi:L-ascorbate metabolism protein UlaG (beta-lactamase superfamily)